MGGQRDGGFAKVDHGLGMGNGYQGGVYVQLSYEVRKKGQITLSFTSPEKDFFYIYDVIVKQNKKNASLITTGGDTATNAICNQGCQEQCTSQDVPSRRGRADCRAPHLQCSASTSCPSTRAFGACVCACACTLCVCACGCEYVCASTSYLALIFNVLDLIIQ